MSVHLDLDLVADDTDLTVQLEQHRAGLTRYCRSRLQSAADAEDAVQETLVRAWRGLDRFQGRSSLRSWLYSIANNVCHDMLRAQYRWRCSLEAMADDVAESEDPGEAIAARDRLRQAFVATLLHLPPRQRAALILCEGLRWQAAEVAELLSTSVAAVNSALQRARETLAAKGSDDSELDGPVDAGSQRLLAGYLDALVRYDLDSLVALLCPSDYLTTGRRG